MKKMSLCSGRHNIPETSDGSIFPSELDPLDISGMENTAEKAVYDENEIVLYVTGLSVALVSVINACRKHNIKLTLMHYNRETGDYYPQEVF